MQQKLEYKRTTDIKRYDTKSTQALMFFVPPKPTVAVLETIHEHSEYYEPEMVMIK